MATEPLGKYEIRGTLGRGAMGVVYEGWDPVIARRVAIKTVRLPETMDSELQEELARFRREAQAAGRLNHPNIVGVYDYGETSDVAYIVMEMVDGQTLKAFLDKGELMPHAVMARCMDDVLAALQYSHDNGVVHRDIKPANVMLTQSGRAKIADFGIARIESSTLTRSGTLLGTPAYMSPEQFKGEVVDHRTDIYSSGVLLYQLLTGKRPFEGSLTTIMHNVLNTIPPRPSERSGACPASFDPVVSRAMAKDAADRFPDARAFDDALQAVMAALPPPGEPATASAADFDATMIRPAAAAPQAVPLPVLATGSGLSQAAALAQTSVLTQDLSRAPPARRGSRALIGALVCVCLVAGGALYVWRDAIPGMRHTAAVALATSTAPNTAPVTGPVTHPEAIRPVVPSTVVPVTNTPPSITTKPVQAPPVSPTPLTPTPPTPPTVGLTTSTPPPQAKPSTPPADVATVVPPSPERIQSALRSMRQRLTKVMETNPCALLSSTPETTPGVFTIAGVASNASAAMLRPAVSAALDGGPFEWRVETFDGPYCDIVESIRSVAAHKSGIFAAPNRQVLVDDDLLTIEVTMPDYAAHLIVDYFSSDGTVAHLVPSAMDVKDHHYDDQVFPARAVLHFGQPELPSYIGLHVGTPFGTDMVVVVASGAPLLAVRPVESEDKSASYVAELRAAIEHARDTGNRVTANAFLVAITPKPP